MAYEAGMEALLNIDPAQAELVETSRCWEGDAALGGVVRFYLTRSYKIPLDRNTSMSLSLDYDTDGEEGPIRAPYEPSLAAMSVHQAGETPALDRTTYFRAQPDYTNGRVATRHASSEPMRLMNSTAEATVTLVALQRLAWTLPR